MDCAVEENVSLIGTSTTTPTSDNMKGKYIQGVYFPPRFKPEDYGFVRVEETIYPTWVRNIDKIDGKYAVKYHLEHNCDFPHSPYYILSSEYECVGGGTSSEILYQGAITPSFAKSLFRLFKYRNFKHFK